MKNYTKITAEDVRRDMSNILKRYIGPKADISYKKAARELETEERTLGSWIRGEKSINVLALIKLSLYLPTRFSLDLVKTIQKYKYK
jgi:hypothetical protein